MNLFILALGPSRFGKVSKILEVKRLVDKENSWISNLYCFFTALATLSWTRFYGKKSKIQS